MEISFLKCKNTSVARIAVYAALSLISSGYMRSLLLLVNSFLISAGILNSFVASRSHISRSSFKLSDAGRRLTSTTTRVCRIGGYTTPIFILEDISFSAFLFIFISCTSSPFLSQIYFLP